MELRAAMTVKLELPPDVQAELTAQAQASGLSMEAYAEQVLRERSRAASRLDTARRLAGQRIRELRKGVLDLKSLRGRQEP
jgi:hypothetical protein